MQQVLFLLVLTGGSATARAAALADAWDGAADAAAKSPVGRVVKLLTDMHARLEQDVKADADLQAKLACFCENNSAEKSEAVERAKAELDQLTSEIEARGKAGEVLTSEIAAQVEDAKKLRESFDAAESQRAKEGDANHKEILGLTVNLETMKAAIIVLTRHHATAFPQMSKAFLEEAVRHGKGDPDKDSSALDSWMAGHGFGAVDASTVAAVDSHVSTLLRHGAAPVHRNAAGYTGPELSTLSKAQVVMNNFVQTNSQEFVPFGGEIVGILKQMQDQFTKELSDLEATDKQQAADFAEMKDRLQTAITTSEKITRQKEAKKAENAQARADALEAVDALRGSLTADEAFLVDLEKNCGNREKDFAERKKTRSDELTAVSEAISILNADDNKDLFSKTLGTTALVQGKQNQTHAEKPKAMAAKAAKGASLLQLGANRRLGVRERAVLALQVGRPSAWLQMAASRIEVSRDGFVRVRKAMKDMVVALKQQQQDEVEHKDWCKGAMHENGMQTQAGERALSLLDAERDTLTQTMQELADGLEQTHAEVKDLEVNTQRANQNRLTQNKDYQQTVDEQRATQVVLQRALDKLASFYDAQAAALVQSARLAEAKKAKQAPAKAKAANATHAHTEAANATQKAAPAPDKRAVLSGAIHKMAKALQGLKADSSSFAQGGWPRGGPSFIQLAADPPQELAGGLDDYKKHAGGGSVMTLLRSLVTEAKQLEAEATRAEQSAHDAYVAFIADANKSHAALGRAIVAAHEQRAEAEVTMAQLKEDTAAQNGELEDLAAKLAAAHKACDYVLDNFDTRQVARQTEIDALNQADAILAGAA